MKKLLTKRFFIALQLLLVSFELSGISVGSDGQVSYEALTVFPQADGDNEMNGFSQFEAGFTLEDSSTSCIFDSFFPVSGTVEMNAGTLNLSKDLFFFDETSLLSMGSINGAGHLLDLSQGITAVWAPSSIILDNLGLSIKTDVLWRAGTTFQGTCTVDGQGKTISLDSIGSMAVASGGSVIFKNMKLSGLSASNLSCNDNTASIMFENCEVSLSNDFVFSTGSIGFFRDVFMTGTSQFMYSSSQTSTIMSQSSFDLGYGMTFYYAPSVPNRDLLYMTDKSSSMYFDGCTIRSTETGMRLTRGRLFLDNLVTFSSDGASSPELICFGDGTALGDLSITWASGAWLDVYGGLEYDVV